MCFGRVIRQIADLMPATCSRGYDLCPACLIFDLVDQILGDLDRRDRISRRARRMRLPFRSMLYRAPLLSITGQSFYQPSS